MAELRSRPGCLRRPLMPEFQAAPMVRHLINLDRCGDDRLCLVAQQRVRGASRKYAFRCLSSRCLGT